MRTQRVQVLNFSHDGGTIHTGRRSSRLKRQVAGRGHLGALAMLEATDPGQL